MASSLARFSTLALVLAPALLTGLPACSGTTAGGSGGAGTSSTGTGASGTGGSSAGDCPTTIAAFCASMNVACPMTWAAAQDPMSWACGGGLRLSTCGGVHFADLNQIDSGTTYYYDATGALFRIESWSSTTTPPRKCDAGTGPAPTCTDSSAMTVSLTCGP